MKQEVGRQVEGVFSSEKPPWIDRYPGKYNQLEQELWNEVREGLKRGLDSWIDSKYSFPIAGNNQGKHLIRIPNEFLFTGDQDFSAAGKFKRFVGALNLFSEERASVQSDTLKKLTEMLTDQGHDVLIDMVPHPYYGEYPPDYYLSVKVQESQTADMSQAAFSS